MKISTRNNHLKREQYLEISQKCQNGRNDSPERWFVLTSYDLISAWILHDKGILWRRITSTREGNDRYLVLVNTNTHNKFLKRPPISLTFSGMSTWKSEQLTNETPWFYSPRIRDVIKQCAHFGGFRRWRHQLWCTLYLQWKIEKDVCRFSFFGCLFLIKLIPGQEMDKGWKNMSLWSHLGEKQRVSSNLVMINSRAGSAVLPAEISWFWQVWINSCQNAIHVCTAMTHQASHIVIKIYCQQTFVGAYYNVFEGL